MNRIKLQKMLQEFLIEDIGELDITSETIFPLENKGNGVFIAKENGIISGLDIIKEAYHLLDSSIEVELRFSDGDRVSVGDNNCKSQWSNRPFTDRGTSDFEFNAANEWNCNRNECLCRSVK